MLPSEVSLTPARNRVFDNSDLLRLIGSFLEPLFPFILSFKDVYMALRPRVESKKRWIVSKRRLFTSSVSVVEWAESIGCCFLQYQTCHTLLHHAASCGSQEVFTWALQKYSPSVRPSVLTASVFTAAVNKRQIEMLQYLRSLDPPCQWDETACEDAAREGNLTVLQWLRSQDPPCPWNDFCCSITAYHGNFELLKWLRFQDPPCPWGHQTFFYATRGGFLEIIIWLRAQDPPCPWDERGCEFAVMDQHLHVLKWLRAQDPPCPWDRDECLKLSRRFPEVHKWIAEQDP